MIHQEPSGSQPEEPPGRGHMPEAEQQALVERHSSEGRTSRLAERFVEGLASGIGEMSGRLLVGIIVLGVVALVALF